MRIIYIDHEFKCHVTNDGTLIPIETEFFDGKCDTFIEGYRFVPKGKSWIRSDGVVFSDEMIAPWKDYKELASAQRKYENELLTEYQNKEESLITSYIEGVNSI